MGKKYAVLFVMFAFMVLMAGEAWAVSIPSFSGADQTDQPGTMNIDMVGVQFDKATCGPDGEPTRKSLFLPLSPFPKIDPYTARPVCWSEDVTVNGEGPLVLPAHPLYALYGGSSLPSPFGFGVKGEVILIGDQNFIDLIGPSPRYFVDSKDATFVDALLFYLGRGIRRVDLTFSGDATDTRWMESMDFVLKSGGTLFDDVTVSTDSQDGHVALAGSVCEGGVCNTLYTDMINVYEIGRTDYDVDGDKICSGDLGLFMYMPCGDFVKDWQVYNRKAYDGCQRSLNGCSFLRTGETVFPQDMVRYSANTPWGVLGTHALHVGPYVVETYSGYPSTTGAVDVLVERILNQSGASVTADLRVTAGGETYFNWLSMGQASYIEDGYRRIYAYLGYSPTLQKDTAYLDFQEWDMDRFDANRTDDGEGNTWYTWVWTTDQAATNYKDAKGQTITKSGKYLDLAPGFARYYMYSADETEEIEMCFVDADAREDLCQTTTIDPQLWFDTEWCACDGTSSYSGCGINSECGQCFFAVVMSADENVRADLAGWTGIEAPKYTAENTACGSCEGQMIQRLDENNYLYEPFASLNACEGSTVCWGASLDVVICDPICDYDLKDIHLTRVTFKIAKNRICDPEVEANITAAIAKLGDDPANKPVNVAPADAILNPASVDATLGAGLDIVVILPDGTKANLVELAKANEYLDSSLGYQGIKNYFEAWALENMSVWEAWNQPSTTDDDEILLSCHVALVNGDVPEGQDAIQAKKGYFLIYTGKSAGTLANPLPGYLTYFALMTGFDPNCGTPEPPAKPKLEVTSDPSPAADPAETACSTFSKDSFSEAAWAKILEVLNVTEAVYNIDTFSATECRELVVEGLTAGQSVDVTVKYENGAPAAAADSVTRSLVFVYDTGAEKYEVFPLELAEVSVATAQEKTGAILEGGEYDQDETEGVLKTVLSLVSVTADPKVTTPPVSGGGGSGCSFGFAPLALLLLAPLALLKK